MFLQLISEGQELNLYNYIKNVTLQQSRCVPNLIIFKSIGSELNTCEEKNNGLKVKGIMHDINQVVISS